MEDYGGTDVCMHKTLTLAWEADEWSASSSVRFIPCKRPLLHSEKEDIDIVEGMLIVAFVHPHVSERSYFWVAVNEM